jgi:hypothetical protein
MRAGEGGRGRQTRGCRTAGPTRGPRPAGTASPGRTAGRPGPRDTPPARTGPRRRTGRRRSSGPVAAGVRGRGGVCVCVCVCACARVGGPVGARVGVRERACLHARGRERVCACVRETECMSESVRGACVSAWVHGRVHSTRGAHQARLVVVAI